jgi:hypothetical protein
LGADERRDDNLYVVNRMRTWTCQKN